MTKQYWGHRIQSPKRQPDGHQAAVTPNRLGLQVARPSALEQRSPRSLERSLLSSREELEQRATQSFVARVIQRGVFCSRIGAADDAVPINQVGRIVQPLEHHLPAGYRPVCIRKWTKCAVNGDDLPPLALGAANELETSMVGSVSCQRQNLANLSGVVTQASQQGRPHRTRLGIQQVGEGEPLQI